MNASREKMQKMQKIGQIESLREGTSQKTWKHLVPLKTPKPRSTLFGELLSFVIKVAALEIVRRISKANCPTLWRVVQAFQVFSYPPLKWLQRWGPLWIIVKGAQKISKPLLLLSIATTFSDYSNNCRGTTDKVDDSLPPSRSLCETSTFDAESEESSKEIVRDNWQLQLFAELEKQGISLPERFKEDELHRFYAAANGDFACLVCSLKKTIRWRESFNILSSQELEVWSHLVFWHRCDAMVHPCLVIRLGLACSTLAPLDRPCFARAIVSQIDHGILSLMNENDARIMVLMDCEGLSILKLPINMIRSYIILVQDHYPNRLGTLFILRLPRVIRVLAQSFIQVLMAGTRKKIRIVGENNHKLLLELGEVIPAFLGGDCSCLKCRMLLEIKGQAAVEEVSGTEPGENAINDTSSVAVDEEMPYMASELAFSGKCDHGLRTAIAAFFLLWLMLAIVGLMNENDSLSPLL